MTPVKPRENLWAALWKSAATEVVARRSGVTGPDGGIELDDPLLAAVDVHLDSVERGVPLPKPDSAAAGDDDPEVAAYLAQLYHRAAHARIAKDSELEAELNRQLAEFKFGNPPWQEMLIKYFDYYWQYPYHLGGEPQYRSWRDAGGGNLDYATIRWRLPADATIAIIGDIGTGTDVAAAVIAAALSFKPDAVLHLGDVYYSGTQFEVEHRFAGLFHDVFEHAGSAVPVFTVPGNHEYFTGGVALLGCLDSGQMAVSDDQRQSASYFCLRSADDGWQFLGMDTGFNGHAMSVAAKDQDAALRLLHARDPHSPEDPAAGQVQAPVPPAPMVMLRDDELEWHQHKLRTFPGRSILLSHHQLYSAMQVCGVAPGPSAGALDRLWVNTGLWHQLGADFADHVAAWIWGHEHNLGIFEDSYVPADWPAERGPEFQPLAKGRCAGHGAIPVQESENPYAQTYPVPLASDDVQLGLTDGWYNRGFEVLDLHGAGSPARMRYFQITDVDAEPLLIHEETVA